MRSRDGGAAHGGYYRASVARSLPAFLARYPGISVDALLAEAEIDPAQVDEPEAIFGLSGSIALLEHAAELTGNAFFGLDFGAQIPWPDLGVLGYVMASSASVGDAFKNARRYSLQQSRDGIGLAIDGATARLSYTIDVPGLASYEQQAELVLALLTTFVREHTERTSWSPDVVHLVRTRPRDRSHARRFFGAPVELGQAVDELLFSAKDLELPVKGADPRLLPILVRHAEDCLARLPRENDELVEIRRAVVAMLSAGECSIEHIARRVHASTRSLQRRLAEHDVSFKSLVEETRLALSKQYLADPSLSLTETAFLLGYSDLSAFSRAFKRWTGQSARELRRRAKTSRIKEG